MIQLSGGWKLFSLHCSSSMSSSFGMQQPEFVRLMDHRNVDWQNLDKMQSVHPSICLSDTCWIHNVQESDITYIFNIYIVDISQT